MKRAFAPGLSLCLAACLAGCGSAPEEEKKSDAVPKAIAANPTVVPTGEGAYGTPMKDRVATLGKGGGYVLASSHDISADTPTENVLAMYEPDLRACRPTPTRE